MKNLAVLMDDCINQFFFLQEIVWPFCRAAKKSGRNKEVTGLPR